MCESQYIKRVWGSSVVERSSALISGEDLKLPRTSGWTEGSAVGIPPLPFFSYIDLYSDRSKIVIAIRSAIGSVF